MALKPPISCSLAATESVAKYAVASELDAFAFTSSNCRVSTVPPSCGSYRVAIQATWRCWAPPPHGAEHPVHAPCVQVYTASPDDDPIGTLLSPSASALPHYGTNPSVAAPLKSDDVTRSHWSPSNPGLQMHVCENVMLYVWKRSASPPATRPVLASGTHRPWPPHGPPLALVTPDVHGLPALSHA